MQTQSKSPPTFKVSTLSKLFFGERSSKKKWMTSLDGLRGLAVLLVFLAHAKRLFNLSDDQVFLGYFFELSGTALGRSGVYLFFILSSFLLTGQLLRENVDLKSPKMWLNYSFKRFLRIYPLYMTVLAVYLVVPSFKYSIYDVLNHLFLREGLGHFWTIIVEFKYYLILPGIAWLLVVVLKRNLIHSIIAFVGLIGVTEVCSNIFVSDAPLSILPHLPIFLMGSIAALINSKIPDFPEEDHQGPRLYMEVAACLSLVGLLFSFPNLLSRSLWSQLFTSDLATLPANHWVYTIQALFWCIFLITHLHGIGLIKKVLEHPILRFIGVISFGFYLWHIAILGYLEARLQVPSLINFVAVFLVTVFVASVTYLAVEKPFLKIKLLKPRMKIS